MSESTETKSTGPRTAEGKAIAAQNARKTGLFTARDFIRPDEQNEHEELRESLEAELNPEGPLENQIASEIRAAIWRLRRCAQLEAALATQLAEHEDAPDPMDPASRQAKQQLSIDRARNQATRLLHKNTTELRRLQTERQFRNEIAADADTTGLGLCDFHTAISHAGRIANRAQRRDYNQLKNKLETMELEGRYNAHQEAAAADEAEFTKRTPPPLAQIARNAPCPCNSGEKYKRCCGKQAPPILGAMKAAA
jgi:hypothetical protein